MKLYYALDLYDDPALIARYEQYHRPENIWPEVVQSIRAAGIRNLEIFRAGNRLVMVLDVAEDYSAEAKVAADAANARVQAWETLMWQFQKPLPFAGVGEKWVPMTRMFCLRDNVASAAGREVRGTPGGAGGEGELAQ